MDLKSSDRLAALQREFGKVGRPKEIQQEAYDHSPKDLLRLVRLDSRERADAGDLWNYTQDLLYTNIQKSLLLFLLPFCLDAWSRDLSATDSGYGGFVEHFYTALAKKKIFDEYLTAEQAMAVAEFMRGSILDEIDEQRGLFYEGMNTRPYRWISALMTYGILLPDLERLWGDWWSLDTVGRATAAIQYASCLIYPEEWNPVFSPWTSDRGGGPPLLWEFEGFLYEHRWLDNNLEYLRRVLTPANVTELVSRAVERLEGQHGHDIASRILSELPRFSETLKDRCAELPRLLEMRGERPLSWTR
jgi:hypothetical protein